MHPVIKSITERWLFVLWRVFSHPTNWGTTLGIANWANNTEHLSNIRNQDRIWRPIYVRKSIEVSSLSQVYTAHLSYFLLSANLFIIHCSQPFSSVLRLDLDIRQWARAGAPYCRSVMTIEWQKTRTVDRNGRWMTTTKTANSSRRWSVRKKDNLYKSVSLRHCSGMKVAGCLFEREVFATWRKKYRTLTMKYLMKQNQTGFSTTSFAMNPNSIGTTSQ